MCKGFVSLGSLCMANAAAPDGCPRGGSMTASYQKIPAPPCLGEVLRRVILVNTITFKRK
jgi:hypothetical protein